MRGFPEAAPLRTLVATHLLLSLLCSSAAHAARLDVRARTSYGPRDEIAVLKKVVGNPRSMDPNALVAANLSPGGRVADYVDKSVPVNGPRIYTRVIELRVVTQKIGAEDQTGLANPTAPAVRYDELGAKTNGAD